MIELKIIEKPYFMYDNKVHNIETTKIWFNINANILRYIFKFKNYANQLITVELNSDEVFETKEELLKSL